MIEGKNEHLFHVYNGYFPSLFCNLTGLHSFFVQTTGFSKSGIKKEEAPSKSPAWDWPK